MEKIRIGHEFDKDCLEVWQLLPQLAKSRSIGHTRRLVKAELKKELGQIDALVKQILAS